MVVVRESILGPVAITVLRPTQITVGLREVSQQKRERLRERKATNPKIPRRPHDPGGARAARWLLRHRSPSRRPGAAQGSSARKFW